MLCNAGKLDRLARIVVGAVLTSLAFVGPANPWFFLGLIPLITGAVGFCPLYPLLGINTCERPLKKGT